MTADTYTPEAPPVDPAEALSLLSRLVKQYGEHAKHKAVIEHSAQAQCDEITAWADEEEGKDTAAMAALTEQMRPLARIVMEHDPKGRKTVTLPGGSEVCFREGRESIEVEDEAAFVRWALNDEVDGVSLLRQPPPPLPKPDLLYLKGCISQGDIIANDDGSLSLKAEDGERIPIPGVRLVKADETFSVKTR